VSERIGKKPHEADLSYTAVCTGLSKVFKPDRQIGKEAKRAKGTRETKGVGKTLSAEGAKGERLDRGKDTISPD
jgi:hypothetical protein